MEIELLSNMNFVQIIKKPFSDVRNMSIGFFVLLISFFISYLSSLVLNVGLIIITAFTSLFVSTLILGYGSKVINGELNGEKELPSWENIPDMILSGVKYTIVSIVYLLPVMIITIIFFIGVITSLLMDVYDMVPINGAGTTFLSSFSMPMLITSLILILVSLYFLTGALANFSKNQDLMDGFNFKEIWSKVSKKNYFLSMLILLLILGVIQIISLVLSFLFGGVFLISLVIFVFFSWISVVIYHTGIGRAYNN